MGVDGRYQNGKLSLETVDVSVQETTLNLLTPIVVLDTSKHSSFGIIIVNTGSNALTYSIQSSNNPSSADSWVTINAEADINAGAVAKVSQASIGKATRVLAKSETPDSHTTFTLMVRLNPTILI